MKVSFRHIFAIQSVWCKKNRHTVIVFLCLFFNFSAEVFCAHSETVGKAPQTITVDWIRYTVISTLGSGNQGDVYIAKNNITDNLVALKIISKDNDSSELLKDIYEIHKTFYNEFDKLNGWNPVEAVELKGNELYIISSLQPHTLLDLVNDEENLEYKFEINSDLDSETLEYRINKAYKLIKELGGALINLHNEGYIYRDLKPANILITENGEALIHDIDTVLRSNHKTQPYLSVSGAFSPAENFSFDRIDSFSDLYSLAMVWKFILYGLDMKSPQLTRIFNRDYSQVNGKYVVTSTLISPEERSTIEQEVNKLESKFLLKHRDKVENKLSRVTKNKLKKIIKFIKLYSISDKDDRRQAVEKEIRNKKTSKNKCLNLFL